MLFGPLHSVFLESGDPPCQYHNAIFPSADFEYFILECLGPGIPTVSLYKMEMSVPRLIATLQNNTLLRVRFLTSYKLYQMNFIKYTFIINICFSCQKVYNIMYIFINIYYRKK